MQQTFDRLFSFCKKKKATEGHNVIFTFVYFFQSIVLHTMAMCHFSEVHAVVDISLLFMNFILSLLMHKIVVDIYVFFIPTFIHLVFSIVCKVQLEMKVNHGIN